MYKFIKSREALFSILILLLISGCSTGSTPVYTLTVEVLPSDAGIVSPETGEYDEGEEVQITATANEHWVFSGWQGETESANPLVLVMDEDKVMTAFFEKREYALNIEVDGEGAVTEQLITAKTDYEHGSEVRLTAEPAEGWEFVSWDGDLTGSENPLTVEIEEETNITAVFEIREYKLNIETEGEGSVNEQVVHSKTDYEYGARVELTAEPANGWEFIRWEGDLTGSSNPSIIEVEEEKNVTAIFEAESSTGGLIDNVQALSDVLEIEGGEKVQGTIPAPENHEHGLGGQEQYVITQNSSGSLNFEVGLPDEERLAGAVFLQLEGTDEYFVVPIEDGEVITEGGPSKALASTLTNQVNCAINAPPCQGLSLPVNPMQGYEFPDVGISVSASVQVYIPAAVEPCCDQLFQNTWDGYDNPDNWSEPVEVQFKAMNVGEGEVQITLTWDAEVDLDLHVTEPDGFEIYYADPQSPNTSGFLDYDNIFGYGPENIFYEEVPPSGTYTVSVVYFSGSVPSNYNVSVSQGGSVSTFSGTLSESDDIHTITTFEGGN